jgi:hypothetical protein
MGVNPSVCLRSLSRSPTTLPRAARDSMPRGAAESRRSLLLQMDEPHLTLDQGRHH